MAVKYRLEYTGLGNYESKIEIFKKDYTGSIIELKGSSTPFELFYETSDDYQFSKFKSSYCYLNIFENTDLKNDFKEIADEDDYIIRYYRDNNLNWSGYIMQEQYSESDDINQPITLKFYDGISRLKIFTFDDLDVTNKTTYSMAEIFNAIDVKLYTNLGGTRGFYWNNFLINTSNQSLFLPDVIFFQKDSFFDKDGISLNLYKILENIADSFNLTYLLYKDRFVVTNFEYTDNPKFVDYSNVSKPVLSFDKRKTITNEFINISKETTFFDSLKKMEVIKNYDFPLTFAKNNDFDVFTFNTSTHRVGTTPIITQPRLTLNSFIYTNSWLDDTIIPAQNFEYRNVFVNNSVTIDINKPNDYINEDGEYVFEFKYRFNYDLNIIPVTSQEIEDKNTLINNSELRICFNVRGFAKNDIDEEIEYEYVHDGYQNFPIAGDIPYEVGVFQLENFLNGTDLTIINNDERIFKKTFKMRNGTNKLSIKFFQPYIDTKRNRSGNTISFESTKLQIYDFKIVRLDRENLGQNIWEGTTDRNIFNYNLNRNKEIYYINNLTEKRYPFNLLTATSALIPLNSFKRRTKLYNILRGESFDLYQLILNQSLEQFGLQQININGDLLIKDIDFDIFSSLSIDNIIFSIHKYKLNDYDATYSVDIIEIK